MTTRKSPVTMTTRESPDIMQGYGSVPPVWERFHNDRLHLWVWRSEILCFESNAPFLLLVPECP